jgi:hypothetical protein
MGFVSRLIDDGHGRKPVGIHSISFRSCPLGRKNPPSPTVLSSATTPAQPWMNQLKGDAVAGRTQKKLLRFLLEIVRVVRTLLSVFSILAHIKRLGSSFHVTLPGRPDPSYGALMSGFV